jgi:hypothetical protein
VPNSDSCLRAPQHHTGCPWTLQQPCEFLAAAVFCLMARLTTDNAT